MSKPLTQIEKLQRYNELIRKQTGKVVRPARFDGYKNLLNKYGTSKDTTEHYFYAQETDVNDDQLTILYEGNGLFSKIIDAPAEEAVKHGFELKDLADQDIEAFYSDALDELDWEESAITAVKWARLFGGSIIVMLIDDGRGIEEPLDWKNIRSIDDMRVYERAIIQPDYTSMFHYEHEDPFRTRGSRLGMPERFYVTSRWGSFCVHESRCLVFQNGVLPENMSNSIYQIWGVPEYFRLKRALRDAEVAHGTATKLLDRSVQAVYKMKNLAEELATEEGEDRVLRRLQTIDMARGLLNSITIDAEGEEYDFRQFSYSGVSEVIDTTCNFLSALTSIPQTILFGRSPAGMNATGTSDLENWYNYVERLQKRMLRSNLRYLLAVIFQAGINAGDIDEVPDIKVQFSPLWSMSDMEQADLDLKKAQIQQTKAGVAVQYIQAEVLDPTEVRKKLADSDEFDVETMLDEYTDDELFPEDMMQGGEEEQDPMAAMMAQTGGGNQAATGANLSEGNNPPQQEEKLSDSQTTTPQEELNPTVDIQERNKPEDTNAPASEPAATKLPQDKSAEEQKTAEENTREYFKNIDLAKYDEAEVKRPFRADDDNDSKRYGVGVYVVKNGKILCGTRMTDTGKGQIAGPGGHVHIGETPEQAAIRETEEEFGITPTDLMYIGKGGTDAYGIRPYVFLCTEYNGRIKCKDGEMADPKWATVRSLKKKDLFDPFESGIAKVVSAITGREDAKDEGDKAICYRIYKAMGQDPTGMKPDEVWDAIKALGSSPDDVKYALSNGGKLKDIAKAIKEKTLQVKPDKTISNKQEEKPKKAAEKRQPTVYNYKGRQFTKFTTDDGEMDVTGEVPLKFKGHGKAVMLAGKVKNINVFAGVPGKGSLDVEEYLIRAIGGGTGEWKHAKGDAKCRLADGTVVVADVHWFEHDEFGQTGWKIKEKKR